MRTHFQAGGGGSAGKQARPGNARAREGVREKGSGGGGEAVPGAGPGASESLAASRELGSLRAALSARLRLCTTPGKGCGRGYHAGAKAPCAFFFLLLTDSLVCDPQTNRAQLLAWNLI